jgi:hypothetical protein
MWRQFTENASAEQQSGIKPEKSIPVATGKSKGVASRRWHPRGFDVVIEVTRRPVCPLAFQLNLPPTRDLGAKKRQMFRPGTYVRQEEERD